jgi:exosortase/archaeosortase family protein
MRVPDLTQAMRKALRRDELFAGLFIVLCANGLAGAAAESVYWHGWAEALMNTFHVSVIVLFACCAAPLLALRESNPDEIVRGDLAIAFAVLCLALAPLGKMSWLGLAALAPYVYWVSPAGSARRGAALIMSTVTVPMLWGMMFLKVLGRPLLMADAWLVGSLIGTEQVGNLVMFADGTGSFEIYPGCSSLHNMSLGVLAWVTASQLVGHKASPRDLLWCALAASSVLAVNAARLSLIGLYRDHFDTIHGTPGEVVSSWLSMGLIVAICWFGLRREISAQA